jgi:hypothetical protein
MSNDFKSTLKWGEQRGDRFLSYLRTTTMVRSLTSSTHQIYTTHTRHLTCYLSIYTVPRAAPALLQAPADLQRD